MDASRFDRLSRMVARAETRRNLVRAATALAMAGLVPAQSQVEARRNDRGVSAEHFRHKQRWYCLDGESIRRYRRKQEKLLAQGATLGKCGEAPCVPTTCAALGFICGPAEDGCGDTLACGECEDSEQACCSGQCVSTEIDENNCGECGNVCEFGQACSGGECGGV